MKLSVREVFRRLDRRSFLQATAMLGVSHLALRRVSFANQNPSFSSDPFTLGVASGDPTADGFVLWTRLAPDPLHDGGMPPEAIQVRWEIATDDAMRNIVQSGDATATAELAHSVHVEPRGLQPNRPYWYRFQAGDASSVIARTATLPSENSAVDRFRFAFASCQHYEAGYYHAYADMLTQNLDMIVHLGDYIYEGAGTKGKVREVPGKEIYSINDYRNRYAVYKSDEDLKAAHALCPWLITWDDHEFDNNYAADHSEEPNIDVADFLQRRTAAYQAFYEHMPLRAAQLPSGPNLNLYRSCDIGDLISFQVLDTRQYRTPQPCGDGNKQPCEQVFSPEATLLGYAQESWLQTQLSNSKCQWNVLAQQVMMGRVDRNPTEAVAWSMDQWAGYDVARRRLLDWIDHQKISNPVVLTGDIHCNWVNDLKVDFDDPKARTVATEFVGTSITSGGDGPAERKDHDGVRRDNPFVKFYNGERGYVACEVRTDGWDSDYRVVKSVQAPESECLSRAHFFIEPDRPGAVRS